MRRRTRARELALQYLYCLEGSKLDPAPSPNEFLAEHTKDPAILDFALALVDGVRDNRETIETELKSVARKWDVSRMAATDRSVLRIGVFELLFRPDIPPQVTLNEAIELAKRYGAEKSGAFVNGLLDAIREKRKREPFQVATLGKGKGAEAAQPDGETDEVTDDGGEFPGLPGS
jgi:transcription antitermination factor NusB